jgi:hypothetical protein
MSFKIINKRREGGITRISRVHNDDDDAEDSVEETFFFVGGTLPCRPISTQGLVNPFRHPHFILQIALQFFAEYLNLISGRSWD